jgi:drug/metabolite transporter, DME family
VAYALVLLAALLWGLLGPLSRGVLEAGVGPVEIAFWRAFIAGLMFLLHAALAGKLALEHRRDLWLFAAFALVGVTLFYVSLPLAIQTGGISLAIILLYTAPAFVALGAWLLLGEAMTPRKLALMIMTLAGVALVSLGGGEGIRVSLAAVFWGLIAGLTYASYYIFGKWVLGRYAPVTIYALVLPLGTLGLLPLVDFSPKPAHAWGLLLALAFLSTYLAYLLYFTGLRRVEASRAVLVASVEPVFAAFLAALLFDERFSPLGFSGAALVLAAAALASLPAVRKAGPGGDGPANL